MKNNLLQKNIPNSWKIKQFEDCVIIPSKLKGLKNSEYKEFGKYPIFDQAQEYISGYSDEEKVLNKNYPAILFGDHTRIIKYIKSPFIPGADGTKIFWAKDGIDSSFLYYSLLNLNIPNTGYNRHFKFLKDSKLSIPEDIKEQKKIAEILSKVDEEINKTDELISKTEELKSGLIENYFNKGKIINIKDISFINKYQISPLKFEDKIFQYIDISSVNDFKISKVTEVTGKEAPSRAKRIINKGDSIISTVRPNLRNLSFIDFDTDGYVVSTGFCVLTPNKNLVNPRYLYYIIFNKNFTSYLVSKTKGSNYPAVNPTDIGEYQCKIPDLKAQEEIVKILFNVDKKLDKQKELKEKLMQIKKGLMSDLLSGKVRVA